MGKAWNKITNIDRDLLRYGEAGRRALGEIDEARESLARAVDIDDHRAALVRAVLGQQWATAIALHSGLHFAGLIVGIERSGWSERITDIPCADAVVADILGESR